MAIALPDLAKGYLRQGDLAAARDSIDALPEIERLLFAEDREQLSYAIALAELAGAAADAGEHAEFAALVARLQKVQPKHAGTAFDECVARLEYRFRQRLLNAELPRDRVTLALASELLASGELDGADAALKPLIERPEEHRMDVLAEARTLSDSVRRARTPLQKDLASARASLRTLGLWTAAVVVGLLFAQVLRRLAGCFPRRRVSLAIAEPAANDGARSAARAIVDRVLVDSRASGPIIDAVEDVDRSGLTNVSLSTEDVDPLRDLISSSDRITIFGFSFTPQQLYSLVVPFLRPCMLELSGTLTHGEQEYRLTLGVKRRRRLSLLAVSTKQERGQAAEPRWIAFSAAERDELLAEVADYVAFETGSWKVTKSWSSFRAYRKARRMLGVVGVEESKAWNGARELLEQALARDPHNVAARYQLGVMLRRVGRNEDAAMHLARLDASLSETTPSAFLKNNPHFHATVRYDLALCYAKQDTFPNLGRAEALFRKLVERFELGAVAADRLAILTFGSLAAVTAGRMALESADADEPEQWRKERGARLLAVIEELLDRIEQWRRHPEQTDAAACSSAWAVAKAAQGRAYSLLKDARKAEQALREARAENPNLACASIHLAQLLIASDEDDEALRLLGHALELSPRNARAHYLIARIQHNRGNLAAALVALEKARASGSSASSDMLYASCLRGSGRQEDALGMLERSIASIKKGRVDYRYQLFLDILSHRPSPSSRQLKLARKYFELIEQHQKAVPSYRRCREYMEELRRHGTASAEPEDGRAGV